MSRTSPHIPEIEVIEERKEKIIKEFRQEFHNYEMEDPRDVYVESRSGAIEDWIIDKLDSYAQEKIDQLFDKETI